MALYTSNLYGKILVIDEAIRTVAGTTALESYGVCGLSARGRDLTDARLFRRKNFRRAVEIITIENRIYIEINIILKYGVSVEAVSESVRSAIKYNVENFTGMIVECVNINVLGIKN